MWKGMYIMKLTRFRIKNFRSIEDSTWVDVNNITNIIGVNESGKSNILLALWKLNPVTDDGKINLLADLPRERYAELKDSCQKLSFIETYWDLTEDKDLLKNWSNMGISRKKNSIYYIWVESILAATSLIFLI